MAAPVHGGVEFLDLVTPAAGPDGWVDPADVDAGNGRPGPRWPLVALVALLVGGVLVAARVLGAPPPPPPVATSPPPVLGSSVQLPAGFGVAIALVTAAVGEDDVVWALGEHGRVARIADGAVTKISDGAGYAALAVRPDGRSVFVATGRLAPTVVSLDPLSLDPIRQARVAGPVTALAAGVGTVWAASAGVVTGWTADLSRKLRELPVPPSVSRVRTLAVVGSTLQANVRTTAGTTGLLRLEPPGGAARVAVAFPGPVSVVPGEPALVAHRGDHDTVEVVLDPVRPGLGLSRPLSPAASLWPAGGIGGASWLVSTTASPSIDCFDRAGQLVGRMTVGDEGRPVAGPVLTTARAVYAMTADGALARGGHGSCGVAPRVSSGDRRGD